MFSTCVSMLMSGNKFQNITKYLHLAYYYFATPILEKIEISKIEPFLKKLVDRWQIKIEMNKTLGMWSELRVKESLTFFKPLSMRIKDRIFINSKNPLSPTPS